jgi:hypothetical protein
MIIADVNTLKSNYNNLDIVPIWCHMNRDWNWVYDATTDLSDTSTIQKAHRAEFVHFNLVGQQEYLNAFSAYIMNVI